METRIYPCIPSSEVECIQKLKNGIQVIFEVPTRKHAFIEEHLYDFAKRKDGAIVAPLWVLAHAFISESKSVRQMFLKGVAFATSTVRQIDWNAGIVYVIHQVKSDTGFSDAEFYDYYRSNTPLTIHRHRHPAWRDVDGMDQTDHLVYLADCGRNRLLLHDSENLGSTIRLPIKKYPTTRRCQIFSLKKLIEKYHDAASAMFLMSEDQLHKFLRSIPEGWEQEVNENGICEEAAFQFGCDSAFCIEIEVKWGACRAIGVRYKIGD